MILGIHYFITKLKTKFDVIPRGCFKIKRCMDNEAAWSENQKTEDYIYEQLSKPIYFKAKCVLCCI